MAERYTPNPRLTEVEVQERLRQCTDPKVIDEIYELGSALNREGLEQLKGIETKATSFAAYGAAIATLLVSSASTWSSAGTRWSLWIAFFAGFSALVCTSFAVQTLKLTTLRAVSPRDWFKEDHLRVSDDLRAYHAFAMWQVVDFRIDVQRRKAISIRQSEIWLGGAVGYLALLLFQIAFVHLGANHVLGASKVQGSEWAKWLSQWGGGCWLLVCGLWLRLLVRRSGGVRVFLCHVISSRPSSRVLFGSIRRWLHAKLCSCQSSFQGSSASGPSCQLEKTQVEPLSTSRLQSALLEGPQSLPVDFAELLSRHRSRYASADHRTRAGESSI